MSSGTTPADPEWDDAERELNALLEERARLADVMELEQMKQTLLRSAAGKPAGPKDAWTEETEAPALSSSATVGTLLSDADKRMALLLADDEADAAAGDNLCDVDASRLAQLLAEDREDIGVGTEPSDDPEELQAQMEAMEAELSKLRLIHDMQSQAAELSQLKAALEMEKRQLLMSKQQLDDIEG